LNVLEIIPKVNTSKASTSKCVEDEDKNDENEYVNKVNSKYCKDDEDENNDNIDQGWEDEDSDDEDNKDEDSEESSEESNNNKSKDENFDDNSNYIDGVKKMTAEEKKFADERGKNYCFVEHVDPISVVGMNLLRDLENQIQSNSPKK
jgi:hypothetical protein